MKLSPHIQWLRAAVAALALLTACGTGMTETQWHANACRGYGPPCDCPEQHPECICVKGNK
jgi:hypothetical protein